MSTRPTPRLDKLLALINAACAARGAKSALARHLGYRSVNGVSNWLGPSAKTKPSAEHTLGMLEWLAGEPAGRAEEARRAHERIRALRKAIMSGDGEPLDEAWADAVWAQIEGLARDMKRLGYPRQKRPAAQLTLKM